MTSSAGQDRNHESIINDNLARLFRERLGMDAVAETLHGGRRPDIVARMPDGAPIVLETEIAPAPTVEADALSRLGMEIDGRRVQNAFAVTAPGRIRTAPQQSLYEQLAVARLTWREWRSDGTAGPGLEGTFAELGDAVGLATPPDGGLEEAVDLLEQGVHEAGLILSRTPGTVARIAKNVFKVKSGDETAAMAALIIVNAMVFQDRLASVVGEYRPVYGAFRRGAFSNVLLLRNWDQILEEDYYPIFRMARDIVAEMSADEASEVLEECASTAMYLLRSEAAGRHDLAGRVFNKLVSERKLLAAFYTRIPSSVLLTGLALAPGRWPGTNWGDIGEVSKFRVVDPACGTGTLPMAAYRQILQNHTTGSNGNAVSDEIHRALVEQIIIGADVVQAAIHLTAATLAAMSPTVRFNGMQLHTLRLGIDADNKVNLGSLEWLASPEVQSFFSATEEQIGATTGSGALVQRPRADLVISNPPYTRRGANGGHEESLARIFSLLEGDSKSQSAVKKKTAALLSGTPANQTAGHGSSFLVLADRMVNPGGRIAFVISGSALFGEAWVETRLMLSEKYEVEFIVCSHDPELRAMSHDTKMGEALIVARRLNGDESPSGRGKFVNLWRGIHRETDALAVVQAVNNIASAPLHRSDGPSVGGSPLIIGGEQWGEIMDGPLGSAPWTSARWRNGAICQLAAALDRGELWSDDSTQIVGRFPLVKIKDFCAVGPDSQQIHGSNGPFNSYMGWNEEAQFHALRNHQESEHKSMFAEPNAWLSPKPERNYSRAWGQAGRLHLAGSIRYNTQRVIARFTNLTTLGVRSWYTLQLDTEAANRSSREIALVLWLNSTFGMLLHANRSNETQEGRGQGNKGMLQSMPVLDVRQLADWQLAAAQGIWRDFQDRTFQSFHQCAVDPARIELDERVARELLGLGEDAVASIARLRRLLASDPSIHGGKKPELPEPG